jgi:hypothetical protein
MIEDRLIDDKITLRDLLAQAVCLGVKAGRKEIDYSTGPWKVADDILAETEEILEHRKRITGIQEICVVLMDSLLFGKENDQT